MFDTNRKKTLLIWIADRFFVCFGCVFSIQFKSSIDISVRGEDIRCQLKKQKQNKTKEKYAHAT